MAGKRLSGRVSEVAFRRALGWCAEGECLDTCQLKTRSTFTIIRTIERVQLGWADGGVEDPSSLTFWTSAATTK